MRPIALGNQRRPLPSHYVLALLVLLGTTGHTGAFGTGLLSAPALLGEGVYCIADIHILTWLVLSLGLRDGRV